MGTRNRVPSRVVGDEEREAHQKKSKSFRIAPDGHWQARLFTDRFGSSEADVLYQIPLVQGGTNVLLPARCVDELYVNTAYSQEV